MQRIGIIGFGHMGSALALGLKDKDIPVAVAEKKPELARRASEEHGLEVFGTPRELAAAADPLILAVKPQDAAELAGELGDRLPNTRIVSIMAGRSMAYIRRILKPGQLARLMPNLAARLKKAVVAVSFDAGADDEFRRICLDIAGAVGTPWEIPESLMPAFTGLSASGLAYVFSFFHAMALGGVKQGLAYDQALRIGAGTVESALALLREGGGGPMEWLARVASPAGTTIQGVAALEELGFSHAVIEAVGRATRRARELEGRESSGSRD